MTAIHMFDDVLPDPMTYRTAALALPYGTVYDFHGIAPADLTLSDWIVMKCPSLKPTLSFFRLSPAGQREPHYIHIDREMGDWTAILYLVPHPPAEDGTRFWRHRASGAIGLERLPTADDLIAFMDESQWDTRLTVASVFNRLLLFPSGYFHSRAMLDNYGDGDEARLIQVVFGTGTLTEGSP